MNSNSSPFDPPNEPSPEALSVDSNIFSLCLEMLRFVSCLDFSRMSLTDENDELKQSIKSLMIEWGEKSKEIQIRLYEINNTLLRRNQL